jgi:hypothetical protein
MLTKLQIAVMAGEKMQEERDAARARIAELEEQCDELKQSRIRLKQETDAFVQARIAELETQLVTCRIRCERAEKRLAQELRKQRVLKP